MGATGEVQLSQGQASNEVASFGAQVCPEPEVHVHFSLQSHAAGGIIHLPSERMLAGTGQTLTRGESGANFSHTIWFTSDAMDNRSASSSSCK